MPLLTPPHRLIATPLALPLPSAVPAPLPFSSRPGAQSRIHVGGKRLRAYPCDLFLEPVFAKKTPAASSCALMWTPRTPQLNVGMAPQGSFRRCEKNARPCAAMRRTRCPTLTLGCVGALEFCSIRPRRGRFPVRHDARRRVLTWKPNFEHP